jgi:hypothetical protein
MERRKYRALRGQTIQGCLAGAIFLLVGLAELFAGAANLRHVGVVGVITGAICTVAGVVVSVGVLGEATFVVAGDGIHGYRRGRRLDIPWSSVRSLEVAKINRRQRASAVWVHLNDGKRIPLSATQGSRERATTIAGELSQARAAATSST